MSDRVAQSQSINRYASPASRKTQFTRISQSAAPLDGEASINRHYEQPAQAGPCSEHHQAL
jgi:hypothetical protein